MMAHAILLSFSWLCGAAQEDLTFGGHGSRVESLAFSPDGTRLISEAADGVILWDPVAGKEVRRVDSPAPADLDDGVRRYGLYFSPKAPWFWSSVLQGFVSSSTGASITWAKKIPGRVIAVSPGGNAVAILEVVGSRQSERGGEVPRGPSPISGIIFWDLVKGSGSVPLELPANQGVLPEIEAFFEPAGKTLMTWRANDKDKRTLWDVDLRKTIREMEVEGWMVATFSPDGRTLLAVADGRIREWSAEPWKETHSVELKAYRQRQTTEKGDRINALELRGYAEGGIKDGANARIRSFTFRPDRRVFAIGLSDGFVRRWDVETGNELGRLPGRHSPVTALAFSPDGKILATGSDDGAIVLRWVRQE